MEEFLKELTSLCKKHNKYIYGCGKEDENAIYVNDDWHHWIELDKETQKYFIEK